MVRYYLFTLFLVGFGRTREIDQMWKNSIFIETHGFPVNGRDSNGMSHHRLGGATSQFVPNGVPFLQLKSIKCPCLLRANDFFPAIEGVEVLPEK